MKKQPTVNCDPQQIAWIHFSLPGKVPPIFFFCETTGRVPMLELSIVSYARLDALSKDLQLAVRKELGLIG